MKRIANIVFYKFNGERPNMKQACIFYTDGTVKNVSYEDGLDACTAIVEANNITTRDSFKELINRQMVYVMSGSEFERRFKEFISREDFQYPAVMNNQNTAMVPFQKVKRPVYNPVNNINNKVNEANPEALNNSQNNIGQKVVPTIIPTVTEGTKTTDEDEEIVEDNSKAVEPIIVPSEKKVSNTNNVTPVIIPTEKKENNTNNVEPTVVPTEKKETKAGYNGDTIIVPPVVKTNNTNNTTKNDDKKLDEDFVNGLDESDVVAPVVIPPVGNTKSTKKATTEEVEDFDIEDEDLIEDNDLIEDDGLIEEAAADLDEDIDTDIEDEDLIEEDAKEELPKKKGFIRRAIDKIKNSKLVVKITAVVLALAMGLGLYSCAAKQTKEGQMLNSNIQTVSAQAGDDINSRRGSDIVLTYGNNDYWNNYSFDQLLKVTTNETQKTAMTNLQTTITGFNGDFAKAHLQPGLDVRAALSFDEIVSLQQAYNDYSKDELKAYFNGADIRSADMVRNYKDANLQLMGAYVIETRENPVDMSSLIESEEGKAFYNKYQELFLAAKEATGEAKLTAINNFYKAVREDFPIKAEVRTEGIAHADNYKSITPYKLSVTPMIAAAEIMFQNYEVDYTLNDSEIDFLNDLGLCNYAEETFERIETLTLVSEEDNTNPLYEQYRAAMIDYLKENNMYVIDDEHRELTKLQAFQDEVNWHAFEGTWTYSTQDIVTTETHQETRTWTETETTYREEETRRELPIPDDVRQQIDDEINRENEEERQRAEEEAERHRQELQEEADEEAERIEEEVRRDEEDLQDRIEDANEQIEENNRDDDPTNDTPINEDDLGHGVDFDDDHSDENGNLDDSVENITTDPTGDQTGEPLPDPNQTGAAFDQRGEETFGGQSFQDDDGNSYEIEFDGAAFEVEENTAQARVAEAKEEVKSEPVAEVKEEAAPAAEPKHEEAAPKAQSNEETVDKYIEELAKESSNADEESYQYTK